MAEAKRKEGLAMLHMAEVLESEGRHDEAVLAYRHAYNVCPDLQFESKKEEVEPELPDVARAPTLEEHGFKPFDAAALASADGRKAMEAFYAENGYLVVHNVLTPVELAASLTHYENYMHVAAEIDVLSKESLDQHFADRAIGIVGKRGAGHSKLNWFVRSRQAVKDVFRLAYGMDAEEKLMTSFDGFNMFRNPETDPRWKGSTSPWFHVDAGDAHTARYVQGVVNLIDCTAPEDAGLVLLPKSHKTAFSIVCPDEKLDPPLYMTYLDSSHVAKMNALYQRTNPSALQPIRVPLPAGSIAVWSSKVLHCNTGCLVRKDPRPEQLVRRVAVYVCMLPDPHDEALTESRRAVFHKGKTTCHQPDIVRTTGDFGTADAIAAGVVIVKEDDLPEGAAELL